jgi:hypothetical protein
MVRLPYRVVGALAGIMACESHLRTGFSPRSSPAHQPQPDGPDIQLVFQLQDDCANWTAALALSRRAASCGGTRTTDKSCACQREAPCDLCLFLNDTLRPKVFVRDLTKYAGTDWEDRVHWTNPWVVIDRSLCSDSHKVRELAGTLIHEAVHLCKNINGTYATAIPVSDPLAVGTDKGDEERARRTEDACGFPNQKRQNRKRQ